MPRFSSSNWGTVARRQAGVVTRSQLRDHGLSDDAIDRLLRTRALDRVGPGVFLARGAPLSFEARLWCAVWRTSGMLGYATGAYLWGVLEEQPDVIDVVIGWTRRVEPPDGVRLHRQAVPPRHDATRHGLPVTSRTWTILDLLGQLPAEQAAQLADRALQRGWLSRSAITQRLEQFPHRPGNTALRRLVIATGDGAAAKSERLLHAILRRGRMTGWTANADIWLDGELIAVADVGFRAERVALEVDGWAYHHRPDRFQRDRTRQNRLVAAGWTVLRFTWLDLTERPEYVLATVRRQLGRAA